MGISKTQALECLKSADLIGIGMEADAVRRGLHPDDVVSYAVERVVRTGAGVIHELQDLGRDSVRLALTPETTFTDFAGTVATLRQHFPALSLHGPACGLILRLAEAAGLTAEMAAEQLSNAGLSSMAGMDATVGCEAERELELHRCAHLAGIKTRAGMVFGAGESLDMRAEHLFAIRDLQEQTGGYPSFRLASYVPAAGAGEAPTAVEYMRMLAVSRMVLDNIENVESDCIAQGLKVAQMALRFGANDAGTLREEGQANFTEEDLRRVIRDAGFKPVERDTLYRTMFLSN